MRSVVVVLPASMWAMIPMLRTRSSPTAISVVLAIVSPLPAVVRERLVGLCHAVHIVLALERSALLLECVDDLRSELVIHVLFAALARIGHKPAQRQRATAPLGHLD